MSGRGLRGGVGAGLALLCVVAGAQQGPPVYTSETDPSGSCVGPRVWITRASPSKTWCCISSTWTDCSPGGGSGAPSNASYITKVAESGLSNEFAMGTLGSGIVLNTTTTGVPSIYGGSTCGAGTYASAASTNGILTCSVVPMDLTIPVYTRAGAPACGSTWLSKEIRVHDTGYADETWICEFDYLGSYKWAIYSQAPDVPVQTMPSGIAFVTVGGVFNWSGGAYVQTNAVAGSASAVVHQSLTAWPGSGCTPYEPYVVNTGRVKVAVGATAQFNRVKVRMNGAAWPILKPSSVSIDNVYQMAEVSNDTAVNPGTPAPLIGGARILHVPPAGSINIPLTFMGTMQTKRGPTTAHNGEYNASTFGQSGTIQWSLSAGQRGTWVKGWSGNYGPTGVTQANYYWATIADYQVIELYCPTGITSTDYNNTDIKTMPPGFGIVVEAVYDDP